MYDTVLAYTQQVSSHIDRLAYHVRMWIVLARLPAINQSINHGRDHGPALVKSYSSGLAQCTIVWCLMVLIVTRWIKALNFVQRFL